MKTVVKDYVTRFEKNHKRRNRFIAMFLCLSLLTSLVVNRELAGVGIAATADYICGQEEHTHDKSCYELVCGLDGEDGDLDFATLYEDGNLGTLTAADVYNQELNAYNEQINAQSAESTEGEGDELYTETISAPVHVHDASCYKLVCDKTPHVHSADCLVNDIEPVNNDDSNSSNSANNANNANKAENANSSENEESSDDENGIAAQDDDIVIDKDTEIDENEHNSQGIETVATTLDFKLSKLPNGQTSWVELKDGDTLTDGDQIKLDLTYSIPHSNVTEDKSILLYDLPEGFTITQPTNGYIGGTIGGVTYGGTGPNDSWGIYNVSESGHVQIQFNKKFLATNDDFQGSLTIKGTAKKTGDGESTVIKFKDDGPTYNIVPKKESSDLQVKKTASEVKDGKITYTVVASSTTGTDDVVKIQDSIYYQGLTGVSIVDNKVTVVDGDGNTVEPTSTEIKDKNLNLVLPKLDANGSYTVTYTVDVSKNDHSSNGYTKVENTVIAKDGDNWKNQDKTSSEIQKKIVEKSGSVNETKTGINWTITVNPDKAQNVAGDWSITDTLDGTSIDWSKVTNLSVKKYDTNDWTGTDITSEFVNNNYSKIHVDNGCSYTITYTTPVTASDETVTKTNKVVVEKDKDKYEDDSSVNIEPSDFFPSKQANGESKEITGTTQRSQQWKITFNPTAGTNTPIVVTDKLTKDDGTFDENVHWTTISDVKKWFNSQSNLEYSVDSVVGYDANGSTISDESAKIVSFVLTLKPNSTWSGKTINAYYNSIFETKDLDSDESITIKNTAKSNDIERESTTTFTKNGDFKKRLKFDGKYQESGYTVDYDKLNDKKLSYTIYVKPDTTDEITITDTLPEGVELSASDVKVSIVANPYNENWEGISDSYGSYSLNDAANKPTITVENNVLTVVLPAGRPAEFTSSDRALGYYIDYTVTVTDEYWENLKNGSKNYLNIAKWGDKTAENNTTIKKTTEVLEKSGEQVKDGSGKLTNDIRYYVTINPAGEKLNAGNPLTLTDKLTTSNGVKVSVDLTKIKLYSYDEKNSANHCIGSLIDSDVFLSNYDESTKTLTMEIPDGTPLVLSYVYTIENWNSQTLSSFSNSVSLEGESVIEKENKVEVKEADSAATVTKSNTLTIVKVDEDRYQKTLEGAEFDVYKYSDSAWGKINDASLVTNSAGTTSLKLTNITRNTLYYLKETKAPTGYTLGTKLWYFVPLESGTTADSWVSNNSNLLKSEDITKDDILFISYNSYGTIYVPNKLGTLQVKKLWFDFNGNEVQGTKDIQVQLYQNTKHLNYKTVTVVAQYNDFTSTYDSVEYQVLPGTEFTLSTSDYWGDVTYKMNDTLTTVSHSGGVTSWSAGTINDDVTIYASFQWGMSVSTMKATYTKAKWVSDDAEVYGEPVTLNTSNSYTYKWENLPATKEVDGKNLDVYYTVEELNPDSTYTVTYINNTGIQSGVITVNNKKNTESEPYKLPNTGGTGTTPYLFGGLATMAASLTVIYFKRRKGKGEA